MASGAVRSALPCPWPCNETTEACGKRARGGSSASMLSSIYMSLFGPNFFAFFPISYTDYSVAPPVCYTCASEYVDRIEVSSPHSLLGQRGVTAGLQPAPEEAQKVVFLVDNDATNRCGGRYGGAPDVLAPVLAHCASAGNPFHENARAPPTVTA